MRQLSFTFDKSDRSHYEEDDFVFLEENASAFKILEKFFTQKDFHSSQLQSLILQAPPYSGKTHLLNIFAKKFDAEFIKIEDILNANFSYFFSEKKFYIFEDIEKIKDEEALFHLINAAFNSQIFLLLTTNKKPEFHLKDLNSRTKNIVKIEIENPSEDSVKKLLINGFSRRQLKVSDKIIDLISSNIKRDYGSIFSAIKKIDFSCSESGKSISTQDIKELKLW